MLLRTETVTVRLNDGRCGGIEVGRLEVESCGNAFGALNYAKFISTYGANANPLLIQKYILIKFRWQKEIEN